MAADEEEEEEEVESEDDSSDEEEEESKVAKKELTNSQVVKEVIPIWILHNFEVEIIVLLQFPVA